MTYPRGGVERIKMSMRAPGVALAASVLCLMGLAWAEAGPEDAIPSQLSLVEAEEIFLTRGFDLLIAEYGAQGAEGDLRAAGAHPNPNLNLT
ncbi:MAG: hypothetical protein WBP56_06805, partial [Polyangia bacterium]